MLYANLFKLKIKKFNSFNFNPLQRNLRSCPKKIFSTETSFSIASFTNTINLLNSKQVINSNLGIDNSFSAVSVYLVVHNLAESLCLQLTQSNKQNPHVELSLDPYSSTFRTSQRKTYLQQFKLM